MNIPEVYLVEPYNAYAPKKKQKHWHEVIEEQALMAKIIAEASANKSQTLPNNAPPIATPTVVPIPPAGGGGQMPYAAYHPEGAVTVINRTPASGPAPLAVQFINLTVNPSLYIYRWEFSDGTYSNDFAPTKVFNTQSNATNVWTASLQISSSQTFEGIAVSIPVYTSASIPTVSSAFTMAWPATLTASFYTSSVGAAIPMVNASTTNNNQPLTYNWLFGSASVGSTDTNPTITYTNAGTYTITLGVTGSYGIKSTGTRKILIV